MKDFKEVLLTTFFVCVVSVMFGAIAMLLLGPDRIEGQRVRLNKETGIYYIDYYGSLLTVDVREKKVISHPFRKIYFDHELRRPMGQVVDNWAQMLDYQGKPISDAYTSIVRLAPHYLIGKKGYRDYVWEEYLLDTHGKVIAGPFSRIFFKDGKIYVYKQYLGPVEIVR